MTLLFVLLCALWGGFLWRVRGGAWETLLRLPPGTTKARIAVAMAMALPLLAAAPVHHVIPIAAALYLGMAIAGWGDAMDIGRVAGTQLLDTLKMSLWGSLAVTPVAIVMVLLGQVWLPLVIVGQAFGLLYAAAWHLPRLPRVPGFAAGPTEWAEVACGAGIGAALAVAVL